MAGRRRLGFRNKKSFGKQIAKGERSVKKEIDRWKSMKSFMGPRTKRTFQYTTTVNARVNHLADYGDIYFADGNETYIDALQNCLANQDWTSLIEDFQLAKFCGMSISFTPTTFNPNVGYFGANSIAFQMPTLLFDVSPFIHQSAAANWKYLQTSGMKVTILNDNPTPTSKFYRFPLCLASLPSNLVTSAIENVLFLNMWQSVTTFVKGFYAIVGASGPVGFTVPNNSGAPVNVPLGQFTVKAYFKFAKSH